MRCYAATTSRVEAQDQTSLKTQIIVYAYVDNVTPYVTQVKYLNKDNMNILKRLYYNFYLGVVIGGAILVCIVAVGIYLLFNMLIWVITLPIY